MLIRRNKATPVTRPAVAGARRALRTRAPAHDYYADVCNQLQLLEDLSTEEDELARRRKEIEEEIERLMRAGELKETDDGVLAASYKPVMGKSSTTVDPLKFKKFAGDAAFWKCVQIPVTKAREFIAEKQFGQVATVVEGKPGAPKLIITRIKKTK